MNLLLVVSKVKAYIFCLNRQTFLFLKSKILSLKGTHNEEEMRKDCSVVVSKVKDTKFERNSQRKSNHKPS